MKPRWILLVALGATLLFCVDVSARPHIFRRGGGGGGGGGGTLSIDPSSLPAGYFPQATALQQARCTGPNCQRAYLPAAPSVAYQPAAPVVTLTPAPSPQPPATQPPAPSPSPAERLAALRAEIATLEAATKQAANTAQAVAPESSADVSAGEREAAKIGAAMGRAFAAKLGIKVQGEPDPQESLAAVVATLPTITITVKDPDGQVVKQATRDFAAQVRQEIGGE